MKKMHKQERVELLICIPGRPIRFVSVKTNGKISDLQVLFPDSKKKFINNGIELVESKTFGFYHLQNGDYIIAISNEKDVLFQSNIWLNLTKDNDNFDEYMKLMVNPALSNEAARLKDLHYVKMERRPRTFRKMCTSFMMTEKANESASENLQSYDIKPDQPSTEALPAFWETENEEKTNSLLK